MLDFLIDGSKLVDWNRNMKYTAELGLYELTVGSTQK